MIVPATVLRTAMTLVSTQTGEVTVRPAEDGWHIRAVSPDHVTLMSVDIPREAFGDDYEVWEPFGVRTEDIIRSLPAGDTVTHMTVSSGRMVVKAGGFTHRRAVLPPEEREPRIPSPELSAEIVTTADRLLEVVRSGDVKYGHVTLEIADELFTATVEDGQGIGVTLEIPLEECALLTGTARTHYQLSAWAPFLRALPKGAELDIRFDRDFPLTASFTSQTLTFMWMVAPLLTEDE